MAQDQANKIIEFLTERLTVLAVVLTSIVEGKTEKSAGSGGGNQVPFGSASPADIGPAATVKTSGATSNDFMKQVVDMMAMLAMSGGMAGMLVALKYYAVKAVSDMVESMTGLEYADDP